MFGICDLSLVPCRSQPFDKSEMVTQLLFGEHFRILEEQDKWILIKIAFDGYECWIDKTQYKKISEEEYNLLSDEPQRLSFELIKKIGKSENILLGSVLPDFKKGKFRIAGNEYVFRGKTILTDFNQKPATRSKQLSKRTSIIGIAKLYLNSPYHWGGRSPCGIDCSGFTQMVFKLNGIQLPRDAWQQAEKGEALNFIEEAQKGDLAFFDNEEGKIVHVGIIIDKNKIIHSSGKVRIDTLDHYGIFNSDSGKYSHNLRVIKKIL